MPRLAASSKEPKKIDGKYASLSFKVGYNALTDLKGFKEWTTEIFAFPKQLQSLDLSFNCLATIPDVRQLFIYLIINIKIALILLKNSNRLYLSLKTLNVYICMVIK